MDQFVENNVYQSAAPLGVPVTVNEIYESHGGFSLNSSLQLSGTMWVTKNGQALTSSLGVANWAVYDKSGVAVSGLSQSGLTADGNGLFIAGPIAASVLVDLTHYVIRLGIVADSVERVAWTVVALGE